MNTTKRVSPRGSVARDNSNGILPLHPVHPGDAQPGRDLRRGIERETASIIWEAGFSACQQWHDANRIAPPQGRAEAPPNPFRAERVPHDYDDLAVARFALVMMKRLADKRAEGCAGWDEADPEKLREGLTNAIRKRKIVDIANYCMFLYSRSLEA